MLGERSVGIRFAMVAHGAVRLIWRFDKASFGAADGKQGRSPHRCWRSEAHAQAMPRMLAVRGAEGAGRPASPVPRHMLGDRHPAKLLEPGRGIFERPDDRLALGDVQDHELDVAPVAVLEAGGERVVVDQAGELEDQVVSYRDAGEEQRPTVHMFARTLRSTSRCSTIAAARGRGRHAFLGPPSFSSHPHSPARVWRGPGERPRLHGIVTGRRSTAKSTVRVGGVPPSDREEPNPPTAEHVEAILAAKWKLLFVTIERARPRRFRITTHTI